MSNPACGSCRAPVNGAVLCTGCTRDLADLLIGELGAASIAVHLEDAVARLLRRGSGTKSPSPEPPLPVDLAASAASDALLTVLYGAVRAVSGRPPLAPATVPAMAYWLAQRLDALRQLDDAAGWLSRIREAVHRALAVVDRKPERAPAGLCDNCGRQLLAELGADEVTCGCGMTLTGLIEQRYERAAKADLIDTPQAIAGALKAIGTNVLPSTIRTWATRGRLAPHGDRHGQPVYSMADVMALCAKRNENVRAAR